MNGNYGRKVTLTWGGVEIDGVREKGLEIAGEPVNVTADSDDGIQVLIPEAAELAHTITLSGVTREFALRYAKATDDIEGDVVMTYPNGYSISGSFVLSAYSEGLPYNDAITFEATLMSNGPIVHDAPTV